MLVFGDRPARIFEVEMNSDSGASYWFIGWKAICARLGDISEKTAKRLRKTDALPFYIFPGGRPAVFGPEADEYLKQSRYGKKEQSL